MIYLDTHVVVWLYAGELSRFSTRALDTISNTPARISPIVLLELQYLYEIQRITEQGQYIAATLEQAIGLQICQTSFEYVVSNALSQTWTRDPFDRLIVAQAALNQAQLVSKDELIKRHYAYTLW